MISRIRSPFYIFFLNPVYVAARSLRSLRSNQIIAVSSTQIFFWSFCFVLRIGFVIYRQLSLTFIASRNLKHFYCVASVASEQQHKQDLRRMYKREYKFSKSSFFTRMLCGFLPEYIAPFYQSALWPRCAVLFLRGLRLRQVSGYGLLWFTCKAMWARSYLAFTTLAVVVNAEFESLEIWRLTVTS